jgi:hypothetical protein
LENQPCSGTRATPQTVTASITARRFARLCSKNFLNALIIFDFDQSAVKKFLEKRHQFAVTRVHLDLE